MVLQHQSKEVVYSSYTQSKEVVYSSYTQGNYSGFLPYLDRFWGTYVPEYLAYRKNKKQDLGQQSEQIK